MWKHVALMFVFGLAQIASGDVSRASRASTSVDQRNLN